MRSWLSLHVWIAPETLYSESLCDVKGNSTNSSKQWIASFSSVEKEIQQRTATAALFLTTPVPGLLVIESFVSEEEELKLLAEVDGSQPWDSLSKREVQQVMILVQSLHDILYCYSLHINNSLL